MMMKNEIQDRPRRSRALEKLSSVFDATLPRVRLSWYEIIAYRESKIDYIKIPGTIHMLSLDMYMTRLETRLCYNPLGNMVSPMSLKCLSLDCSAWLAGVMLPTPAMLLPKVTSLSESANPWNASSS